MYHALLLRLGIFAFGVVIVYGLLLGGHAIRGAIDDICKTFGW